MAIFNRLTKQQIRENFDFYGRFCGIVPVYVGSGDCPNVEVRNWWPEFLLDVTLVLFDVFCAIQSAINPDFEPEFPITLTGKIAKQ